MRNPRKDDAADFSNSPEIFTLEIKPLEKPVILLKCSRLISLSVRNPLILFLISYFAIMGPAALLEVFGEPIN